VNAKKRLYYSFVSLEEDLLLMSCKKMDQTICFDNCVCLLCFKPNDVWIDFLAKFKHYDIFIVVDDNSKDYSKDYTRYSNITIIQSKFKGFLNLIGKSMMVINSSWIKGTSGLMPTTISTTQESITVVY
jgi:hypothetical protein